MWHIFLKHKCFFEVMKVTHSLNLFGSNSIFVCVLNEGRRRRVCLSIYHLEWILRYYLWCLKDQGALPEPLMFQFTATCLTRGGFYVYSWIQSLENDAAWGWINYWVMCPGLRLWNLGFCQGKVYNLEWLLMYSIYICRFYLQGGSGWLWSQWVV